MVRMNYEEMDVYFTLQMKKSFGLLVKQFISVIIFDKTLDNVILFKPTKENMTIGIGGEVSMIYDPLRHALDLINKKDSSLLNLPRVRPIFLYQYNINENDICFVYALHLPINISQLNSDKYFVFNIKELSKIIGENEIGSKYFDLPYFNIKEIVQFLNGRELLSKLQFNKWWHRNIALHLYQLNYLRRKNNHVKKKKRPERDYLSNTRSHWSIGRK